MNKYIFKTLSLLVFFSFCSVFLIFPKSALAEKTPYRSAGWVATEGNPGYSNTDGCQESGDEEYCSRPLSSLYGALFFSSFGKLEDFGISEGSYITKIHIRVTGKDYAGSQLIGLDDIRDTINFKSLCQSPDTLWRFNFNDQVDVISFENYTTGNGLSGCISVKTIDSQELTFRISNFSTSSWSSDIDNFEIAFDYAPPEYPWKNQNDLSVARSYHGAVLLNSGSVLVAGGRRATQTNIVDLFTPGESNEGVWKRAAYMQSDRFAHTLNTIIVNGSEKVLVSGGSSGSCSCTLNTAELYDPVNNNWILVPEMNVPRYFHASSVLGNDKVMITGGNNGTGRAEDIDSTVEIYDSANDAWLKASSMQIPRMQHQQVTFIDSEGKEKVMVIGGVYAQSSISNKIEIYNPQDDTWIFGPDMKSARRNFSSVLLHDGRILVAGFSGDSEVYDPSTNQWNRIPTAYPFYQGGSMVALGENDGYKVLAAGGQGPLPNAMTFDPITNEWSNIEDMTTPRSNFTLTLLKNGSVLAANGQTVREKTRKSEIYRPPGDVLGDSTVAPFLDLPWDYGGGIENFEKNIFDPESWFDHKYPLQNIPCCIFKVFKYTGQEVNDAYRSHSGYDYASRNGIGLGTPVLAAASGIVTFKPEAKSAGAGNIIKIDHGNGYQTWYEHLALDDLIVSDENSSADVEKGQQIGKVGMTGNTNGPHIHFSVFKDENENGMFGDDYPFGLVDPLGWEGEDVDPWTEYESDGRNGAESVKLFTHLEPPANSAISKAGGQLTTKNVKVIFPDGALPVDIDLRYRDGPFESSSATFSSVAPTFFLVAINSLGEKITEFFKPVVIVYNYANVDLTNIEEESLRIMHYNKTSKTWVELASELNTELKKITAETSSFSQFAIMGEIKDSIAPITIISLNGDSGEDNVFRSAVSINFAPEDNEGGIGVKDTIYGINDNAWRDYLEVVIIEEEGEHRISYQSTDLVGNVEDIKTAQFLIDETAPVSALSIEGTDGENGWYIADPTVTLTAEDNLSGIARIEYSLDGGDSFEVYEDPFEITSEGVNELLYRAVDKAGNIEEANEAEIKLDKTAPVSKVYISGSMGGSGWYRSNISFELSGSDAVSGYSGSFYSLDGGENFSEYLDTIIFSDEGEHEVLYYSLDFAGNKEDTKTLVINIDKTSPIVTISADPSELWPPNKKMTNVKINGNVDEENLLKTNFNIVDEYGEIEPALSEFGQTIELEASRHGNDRDGRSYTIEAVAEDLAGNTGEASTQVIVPHDRRN